MLKFLPILLSLALMSCAFREAPYHYHRQVTVWGLGYSDNKLSAGTWYVTYRGHHMTTTQARDIALLRAAYLCSQEGYPWFKITTPNSDQGRVYGQIGVQVRYPESTMIICGSKSPRSFNASSLIATLTSKYGISEAELHKSDTRDLPKKYYFKKHFLQR